jgi:hypothetical protein
VGKQPYERMRLAIRGFGPYICDSIDLDDCGFDAIQKRQLISPMDIAFNNSKELKIEAGNTTNPAGFIPFQRSEIDISKTLLKVTFSDILVLQETSSKLVDSQSEFQDFLIAYLAKLKEEKLMEKPKVRSQSPSKQARMNSARGSFLSLGFRRADSFQSFPGFVEGAYQTLGEGEDQLKHEAA